MYPSDVVLPPNAKYYGMVFNSTPYNINHNIVWSFQFALTGTEHGFVTFLTTNPTLSGIPGRRLGYLNESPFLGDESGDTLLTQSDEYILYDPTSETNFSKGILSIAFDTTGWFALSDTTYTGVPLISCKPNSLIVRDIGDNLLYNESLTSLDTSFFLSSSQKSYQTVRFSVMNAGRILHVDKLGQNNEYYNILSLPLNDFVASNIPNVYVGLSFCSPISSNIIQPSTLYLKNTTVKGTSSTPITETVQMQSIYPISNLSYTSLSTIY